MVMVSSNTSTRSCDRLDMQFVFDSASFNSFDGGVGNVSRDNRQGLKRKRYTSNAWYIYNSFAEQIIVELTRNVVKTARDEK